MTSLNLEIADYSFKKNSVSINNVNVNYIDEGLGEILLFVHGTPSWSYDYRNVIKRLSPYFRCVALDHIGFGLSDKPKDYDYSTENHSRTLEKFISVLKLTNITIIVHDFGGPIGLKVAITHPELFKRFVILNSWLWSIKNEPDYKKLKFIINSPITPFLYKYFNFSPKYLLPMSFVSKKLTKTELQNYVLPFNKLSERKGPLAFAKSLINDQDYFESLWQKKESIIEKPSLFIWGMSDKFIAPKYLVKFSDVFKNKKIEKLYDIGHFPQEEASEKVASSIKSFIELPSK